MLTSFVSLALPLVCLGGLVAAAPGYDRGRGRGIEPPEAFVELAARYSRATEDVARGPGPCNGRNMGVRRSWDVLSLAERRDYIRAVKCLQSRPSIADPRVAPGNRNRRDDFTASHILASNVIHSSGFFLPWHRYFTWSYEKALREECGYRGHQPYWDFSRWSDNQLASPVFDGSPYSLGGDGEATGEQAISVLPMPGLPPRFNFTVHGGSGGGCVKSGPFAHDFQVSLGPVVSAPPRDPVHDPFGLQYNPRCLRRSFYQHASNNLNWANVTRLLQSETIHQFRPLIENPQSGLHISAHGAVGGETVDFYSSPGDPIFFLLHAQIDRLWTLWQGQDWQQRMYGLSGPSTFRNEPPSANVTTDTWMDMGYAGGQILVGEAMSPISGHLCYRYE